MAHTLMPLWLVVLLGAWGFLNLLALFGLVAYGAHHRRVKGTGDTGADRGSYEHGLEHVELAQAIVDIAASREGDA